MSLTFQLERVSCRFGDLAAVDDVSLEIENGERVALIGPSGSGKTTLLRTLNTIRGPDAGTVSVFGEKIDSFGAKQLRKMRSRIALIPQHLGLVPNMSVVQNVVAGRGGKRSTLRSLRDLIVPAKSDVREIHAILERVGIEEKLYNRIDQLSGGQKQRVAIARALFQKPEAILADEPVSAVDPARARDTVKLLTDLSLEKNFTLVVSLHNLELAREFFPRLIGLRGGRVTFDAAPDSIPESEMKALFELTAEELVKEV
ncbi:MAG: ATP-binding cassette domain-containing protein [Verrucomicrobiales bacterium]|nr:ATP-binding cassette domain-containing protein [Verrucomicrobiales bacterium]